MNGHDYVKKLKALASQKVDVESEIIANIILNDPRFALWSGSARPEHHHYGDGKLAQHTWEVVMLSFTNMEALGIKTIDNNELFLAGLYHDVGKIYDYEKKADTTWGGTDHKRLIHHISRSALIWNEIFSLNPNFNVKYKDRVTHAILAHHGSREWGSPVAPKTQVAWLVHLSDMISARMDDWNKSDILNH